MSSAAFRRAKTLLAARPTAVAAARALAVVQSLLLLALLVVVGLLVSLIITRGVARVPKEHLGQVPGWLQGQVPITPHDMIFVDSGLYALAAENQFEESPWVHRAAARLLLGVMGRVGLLRSNLSALVTLLAVALGLVLLLTVVIELRRGLIAEAVTRAAAALRVQIHRQMYRRGQSSLPTEGTGPVVNLFTREVNEVRDALAADLDRSWRHPVLAAGLLLIALALSWKLTLFLLSLGGLVWMAVALLDQHARQDADRAVRDSAVQLALLHEDLGMLRTVRVYGVEAFDKARFDEHLEAFREADERRLRTEGGRSRTTWLLVGAAATVAVGLLGFAVLKEEPEGRVAPATAVVLAAALIGLWRPVARWLDLRAVVRRAGRSARGIFELLEQRPELHQAVGAQFLPPLKERISFENVTLEGPSGRFLLTGVSAEVPARTRTAILSLDEDAKHALVCLIPRLIDPTVGRVRVDGVDLRDVTLESLRAQVATVLQSDLVFSDTVLANIGLGDPSFGLPRIIEAAKVAHAHHFIQDLPHGYDTVIGPLGEYLSVDQQYRLALARAYLHDPAIVIVEEPDAALDDDTKHLIDDTIDRLAAGRTLIFLPHRLSTIRKCDQVVVLHNGRVEAMGPPREVHGQSKLYRHIQYVEFNQFATGEVEAGQMNA